MMKSSNGKYFQRNVHFAKPEVFFKFRELCEKKYSSVNREFNILAQKAIDEGKLPSEIIEGLK